MDCSHPDDELFSNQDLLKSLPEDILFTLRHGTNSQYLNALAALALDARWTSTIFTTHEPLFVDLCSRWISSDTDLEPVAVAAALARVLPFAPHLASYAEELICRRRAGAFQLLCSRKAAELTEFSEETLHDLLLALCRLLIYDNETFASAVSPAQIQVLLQHPHRSIRYLAIRVLCSYLHAADAALASMVSKYLGDEEIDGRWEDMTIDYIFFGLWEEKRIRDLNRRLLESRKSRSVARSKPGGGRSINPEDYSLMTACIAGVLLPRIGCHAIPRSSLVMTETTTRNLRSLADAFIGSHALLVTGFAGSGKTALIRSVANELNKASSMVTLHLNEQSDAKLLLGMYTSALTPGSFSWHPGVLTTAVNEGRWVVIEDLDRAPIEVVSVLLPLIERRQLPLPNRGEILRPATGFKLIATVRTALDMKGDEVMPGRNILGIRHWKQVSLHMSTHEDLQEIVEQKFPVLHAYLPVIMRVYKSLQDDHPNGRSSSRLGRPIGPRDLLRWCTRLKRLLTTAGVRHGNEPVSESINDGIFLEAVDSFAGQTQSLLTRSSMITLIAQHMHVPPARADFCLTRVPKFSTNDNMVHIGRASLAKLRVTGHTRLAGVVTQARPFAMTSHALLLCERIGTTIEMAEPCLLVGETGTGKTATIQHLADLLHRRLTVVNLSQQSEAGDLLGGYKPVNIRALAVPMKEQFDDLFSTTFSLKRNERYLDILGKAVARAQWSRALTLWKEALKMVEETFASPTSSTQNSHQGTPSKRRRIESPKYQDLKAKWKRFEVDVHTFEVHLSSGSKAFAFSFVEGNIVKAARNGDWVLLDEINLASPDTLESLADLFANENGAGPSLLLSEKGDVERIQAHKDFRIFAAMNPATDVGKRDLPMGLRSRFTEFFVDSPDKALDSLIPVVMAYLGSYSNVDVRAAPDIGRLHLAVRQLAEENRLVDGAGQKPHFSLRTLTRTLTYVTDIAPTYGLRRGLFEGFSMSYLTQLDKDSERLILPLIDQHLLGSQKNARALIHQIPRAPNRDKMFVQFRQYWVAQGAFPIQEQPHYIITPFIERNLLNLVRATSTRRFPVLLQGPTSAGKTSMIEYLANISGNKFVRINNHEHTDLQEYLGTYVSGPDGQLRYEEGILVRALREGSWIVLDELNLAPTDVLEALNRLLDDNRELLIPETQQIVRPHENLVLFATQNPPGLYGGRKVLSRAFRNRFLELHFDDIPEDELETILRERSQIAPSFCTKIVAVYQRLSILRQSGRLFEQKNSFATLRDLFRWALRDADDRTQLANNGFMLLAERVRKPAERFAVKKVIEEILNVKVDESALYDAVHVPALSDPDNAPAVRGVVWTSSMRRLYVLVNQALRNKEPVLLIGETGCGKTTICQVIAEVLRTKIHIVNAHQNTETGDLIGAQRPIRNRTIVEAQLTQDLTTLLSSHLGLAVQPGSDLSSMMQVYEDLKPDVVSRCPIDLCQRIMQGKTKSKALFEWSDGSLVQAMRGGHHFLLDEISLAEDSVLERLNSVLEPGRTLLLAEKGTEDIQVIASDGFQFLATMNPGGDYGKKELSPALRNRFTEIWVPSLCDTNDMLDIARAKLSRPIAAFADGMVAFAAWFGGRYDQSNPSSASIRELLAWVEFVNTYHGGDRYFALLHGAAMVYIDALGANPAAKFAIAESAVTRERDTCLVKLGELFNYDVAALYHNELDLQVSEQSFSIGPFALKRFPTALQDTRFCLQAPTTTANAMRIVRALQLNKPILLEGSPGVGKTTLVAALAQAVGVPLTRMNLSEQTDLMDLFGSDVPVEGADAGIFAWREAPFLQAMQKGEWVLLDEMNLASQSVLEGLNACLDHRGQVYVSELDQTFQRHSEFKLFAAQNPHHQGGGRKGLPASFVNRFTVVYADTFTPTDLLTICKQNFPDYPTDEIRLLTECVSAVHQALQQDRRIGARGSPWEFNLRDILRWLHLLTSRQSVLPASSAAEYQGLLFLQRFRTAEDANAVSAILEPHLTQVSRHDMYFQNFSHETIQVGLGVLQRNILTQPNHTTDLYTSHKSIPIMESVMLCVQHNWPCLLVGPSGSGKTNIIRQLAVAVGAELVQFSLNPDMDTMDLVGGYEQLDPLRRITNFVSKLQSVVYAMTTALSAFSTVPGEALDILEEMSRHRPPNLCVLRELLTALMQIQSSEDLISLREECASILKSHTADTGARFGWVDGILIKAMEQGKWLVLDNANLCSPSVLDRLNPLLEPNGFLSINEHRSADGTSKIVKPHPHFRLFLTMDPRHGELSRAMRNRSIEIFIQPCKPSDVRKMSQFSFESAISRFNLFQDIEWPIFDGSALFQLLSTCFDHLSFCDITLGQRWYAQAKKGLLEITLPGQSILSSICDIYFRLPQKHEWLVNSIRKLSEKGAMAALLGSDFVDAQTIHPLNNPAVLRLIPEPDVQAESLGLAALLELSIELGCLAQRLGAVFNGISGKVHSQMSRLERSIASGRVLSFSKDATQPLAIFLTSIHRLTDEVIDELANLKPFEPIAIGFTQDMLRYQCDMFNLGHSSDFDDGVFQVYLSLGRSMLGNIGEETAIRPFVAAIARGLDCFNASWRLSTGLRMEALWNIFRPPTAANLQQLKAILQIEELADRFDALAWKSGKSIEQLYSMRKSIIRTLPAVRSSASEFTRNISDVNGALHDLETSFSSLTTARHPYFREVFEALCQYQSLSQLTGSFEEASLLGLLANRPTRSMFTPEHLSTGAGLILCIQRMIGTKVTNPTLVPMRNTLPIILVQKLSNIGQVTLGQLDLLRDEIDVLATSTVSLCARICENQLHVLNTILCGLHAEIYKAHEHCLQPQSTISWREFHTKFLQSLKDGNAAQGLPDLIIKPVVRAIDPFRSILEEYLVPSLSHMNNTELYQTAAAWVLFFTGCLYLYVPDRAFDPALKPLVERQRHQKRRSELNTKLEALRQFARFSGGQATSLRCYLLEQELLTLGDEPQAHSIARPDVSELGQLQGEFTNILNSIIRRSPNAATLRSVSQGEQAACQEAALLSMNISQAISRLSGGFRSYDDLTQPAIGLLQGLDVGLRLASMASMESCVSANMFGHMSKLIPFLGGQPARLERTTMEDVNAGHALGFDYRSTYLKTVALTHSVHPNSASIDAAPRRVILEVFHSFYEEWKKQLEADQEMAATKSSLYRYRGSEGDNLEADEQDFLELFPDYERAPLETNARPGKSRKDPQILARELATYQREIFVSNHKSSSMLLKMIKDSSTEISAAWNTKAATSRFQIPTENLLPVVVLTLGSTTDSLQRQPGLQDSYNFYTSSNMGEAKNVIALMRKTQRRFFELKDAWPEHATLDEVLRTCDELLAFQHIEPVAKMLTKVEKLHSYVHEWQVVASREYSALTIYDELTSLLVSWRRLELSTWARLLDMEDRKCIQDAQSWWFVAYEVILAAPLSMANLKEDLNKHAEQLLMTLGNFLGTTLMGQYSERLRLIEQFKIHLSFVIQEVPSLKVVHRALINFLSFYARFEKPIHEVLQTGRKKLEQDMKGILLLASWKDTNINALRDSAKRSHHQLFKVIRKYRSLLAQPADSVIRQGLPDSAESLNLLSRTRDSLLLPTMNESANQTCQQSIEGWLSKPTRFTNPLVTASSMARMSELPDSAIDGAIHMVSFTSNLAETIKALQELTPSVLTKDNANEVKHLKSRKRKVFADTLKEMRQMGFRSNIGSDLLATQESLPAVLTSTAILDNKCGSLTAEYYFHKVLDLMPQIREASRKHSEELTGAEVTRSVGYLEGLLSLALRQRSTLSLAEETLGSLGLTTDEMQNLWRQDRYMLQKSHGSTHGVYKQLERTIRWLVCVTDVGITLIQTHSKLGKTDTSAVIDGLTLWKAKFTSAVEGFSTLPSLPVGISTSQHEQAYKEAEQSLELFATDLQRWASDFPNVGFVLRHINSWTKPSLKTMNGHTNGHTNGEQATGLKILEDRVSAIVDSLLVAMQYQHDTLSGLPSSIEDSAWLIREDILLSEAFKVLHAHHINKLLREALLQVQHLDTTNSDSLTLAGALFMMALPIVQQYQNIYSVAVDRYERLHVASLKMAHLLAKSFIQIASQGFCSPQEKSAAEEGKTEKLEGGTGLGEGEGAEDISKDVQEDEDLSELAQEPNKGKDKEDMQAEKDAIDMQHEDLEGDMENGSDKGEDEEGDSTSAEEENELDEEAGGVDDLDPSAIDEKLWDGDGTDAEKDKEGDQSKGKLQQDDQLSASKEGEKDQPDGDEKEEENEEGGEDAPQEGEEVAREETEPTDAYIKEAQALDLPEEIDLDGDKDSEARSDSVDDGLDQLSDIPPDDAGTEEAKAADQDIDEGELAEQAQDSDSELDKPGSEDGENIEEGNKTEDAASPVDTEAESEMASEEHGLLRDHTDNAAVDADNAAQSDVQGVGESADQQDNEHQTPKSTAQQREGTRGGYSDTEKNEAAAENGSLGAVPSNSEPDQAQDKEATDSSTNQAFKKLGDALEKWHRQSQQIQDASETNELRDYKQTMDVDATQTEFEHLPDEDAEADTQALGNATEEQSHALDQRALDSEMQDQRQKFLPDDGNSKNPPDEEDEEMPDFVTSRKPEVDPEERSHIGALAIENKLQDRQQRTPGGANLWEEEDLVEIDNDLSTIHLGTAKDNPSRPLEEARRLWSYYESLTRDLSLSLTEQLRLILAPTLATKMRGDFRTGKRLNIKRIIPYIASQYKRDKIWMRRSVPSKRNYQIMLAVDDSKSMGESESGQLAFETLALISKSLSMLEVGEICVVGFGDEVRVAHEFDKTFSSEAGVQIFQQFGFQQTKTDVRKLVAESINLFREARSKTFNASAELWQLELIISDGVCEDHDTIRRLVRQAQDERIIIVFVIVDALKGESIMDMKHATFEPDATGETKLKVSRYLDGFPFGYYLVVGDVKELPNVLATALRQWFAEVVDSS